MKFIQNQNKMENRAVSDRLNTMIQENEELKKQLKLKTDELEARKQIEIKKRDISENYQIARTILRDYEKEKNNAIERATKKTGMFGNKISIDYEQAFNNFVEYSDQEHNAIRKAILNEPLDSYERENSVIKHITNYLSKARDFSINIIETITKEKDKLIRELMQTLTKTRQELKKYKDKSEFLENLYNSKHDDLAMLELRHKYKQELEEEQLISKEQEKQKEVNPQKHTRNR